MEMMLLMTPRTGASRAPRRERKSTNMLFLRLPQEIHLGFFFFFLNPCFLFASAAPVMMDGLQGGSRWRWGGVALSPWTWRALEEAHVVRWSQLKRKNLRHSFHYGTEPCLQGLCIRTLLSDVPLRTCHMQDKMFCPEINREPPKWLYHPGRLERTPFPDHLT